MSCGDYPYEEVLGTQPAALRIFVIRGETMSFAKSVLCGFWALALSAGVAFAGGSSLHGEASTEISPPELLSDESVSVMELERADQLAGSMESDVIYVYPVEVTEYYLIIPESQDLG
jgi:hypothetical protein